MTVALRERMDSLKQRGFWLRCFLAAVFFFAFGPAWSRAQTQNVLECHPPEELNLSRLRGTVYGPSGAPLPGIAVRVISAGKLLAEANTDAGGRFRFAAKKGKYDVQTLFLRQTGFDLKVRVAGPSLRGLFRPGQLFIVMGLSGTRCSYATTSSKQLKEAIKRYQHQLLEKQ